jgi:hypothetical protein
MLENNYHSELSSDQRQQLISCYRAEQRKAELITATATADVVNSFSLVTVDLSVYMTTYPSAVPIATRPIVRRVATSPNHIGGLMPSFST